jgi:hypothetical protein
MGLTIHYQGQIASEEAYVSFIEEVTAYAETLGWPLHPIAEVQRELTRMLQPEDPEADEYEDVYVGSTRGVYLFPHPECEPLNFEFDADLFMQDWCKTQFAGPAVHAAILDLFRKTENMFEMLDIQDEAEGWENPTPAHLKKAFATAKAAIEEAAAEMPGASVGVLTPSGRILDILADD